jgi:mobilization protein NikA
MKAGQGKAAPWRGRKRVEITRDRFISVRCLPDEHAKIEAAAKRAGLAIGPYLRSLAIGSPGPRAKHQPPVERRALAQVLGFLGRLGSNINQLARVANMKGDLPTRRELAGIAADVRTMRDALMEALGRGH